MNITFHGAAQSVTGSCFLVQAHGCRFLIDCGMAQGGREADQHNQKAFAFDPASLDFVVLTHAHIDHSGLLPKLVARGFKGAIYATLATKDLLEVLLKDSAHIQMVDAERAARRQREGKGRERELTAPLYSLAHVASTLEQVHAIAYGQRFEAHPAVTVCFQDAGHILGSAIAELWLADGLGGTLKLVASGDLGQPGRVILRDPTPIPDADLLLIDPRHRRDLVVPLDALPDARRLVVLGRPVALDRPTLCPARRADVDAHLVDARHGPHARLGRGHKPAQMRHDARPHRAAVGGRRGAHARLPVWRSTSTAAVMARANRAFRSR